MKKAIIIFLAFILTFSLVGCGNSSEAKKADELISAIGEVTLNSETTINTAQDYYDTLTETQKKQVETYSVLVDDETKLKELKTEETKKEQEEVNKQTYDTAVGYEEKNLIDMAYEEYKKLPEDYEDVKERIAKIEPYVGVAGTWVCDELTAKSNKGIDISAMFKSYKLTIDLSQENNPISYVAEWADQDYVNNSIVKDDINLFVMINDGKISGKATINKDGSRLLGTIEAGSSDFGTLLTSFSITSEKKLLVEYTRKSDNTSVSFLYSYSEN